MHQTMSNNTLQMMKQIAERLQALDTEEKKLFRPIANSIHKKITGSTQNDEEKLNEIYRKESQNFDTETFLEITTKYTIDKTDHGKMIWEKLIKLLKRYV